MSGSPPQSRRRPPGAPGTRQTTRGREALARKGGLTYALNMLRLDPPDTPAPRWRSRAQIVAWFEQNARLVGIGARDRQLAAPEMRLNAEAALKAYELEAAG